jgi:hypothetical protein
MLRVISVNLIIVYLSAKKISGFLVIANVGTLVAVDHYSRLVT